MKSNLLGCCEATEALNPTYNLPASQSLPSNVLINGGSWGEAKIPN